MAGNSQDIVVTDIRIPFWSMVVLMVKWALAAVPAVLILLVIGMFLSMILGGILRGVFDRHWGRML